MWLGNYAKASHRAASVAVRGKTYLQVEELIIAGTVKTQYKFEPLTVTAEAVQNEQLVEISSPINIAHVIMDDIKACKVSHTSYPRSSPYPLRIARVINSFNWAFQRIFYSLRSDLCEF